MRITTTFSPLRRLLTATVAVLLVGGPLAVDTAAAQGRDGRGRGERSENRRESAERRGVERRQQMERAPRRMEPQYNRRLEEAPPRAVRRGGYMGPEAGPAVGDYGRYRLRPPPRGYAWYRVNGGYALVDQYSGQVLDMAPD